jgi:hypothetical protein
MSVRGRKAILHPKAVFIKINGITYPELFTDFIK